MWSAPTTKKFILGTAQFGSDYGITNVLGRPEKNEVFSILDLSWELGVRSFDTAPGYNSEALIGDFVRANGVSNEITVLTKIPSIQTGNVEEEVLHSIEDSSKKLGCEISVLFMHDANDAHLLIENESFFNNLLLEKHVKNLGVSIYEPGTVKALNDSHLSLAFQFPFNILDRSFEQLDMPVGKRYARSIFLQGVLASKNLLRKNSPPALITLHQKFHKNMEHLGIDPFVMALSYVACHSKVDYFLLGVETEEQLSQIFQADLLEEDTLDDFSISLELEEKIMLDPRNWYME